MNYVWIFNRKKSKNSYLTHVLLKNYNFTNYYPLYLKKNYYYPL